MLVTAGGGDLCYSHTAQEHLSAAPAASSGSAAVLLWPLSEEGIVNCLPREQNWAENMVLRRSVCHLAFSSCLGVHFVDVTDKCYPVSMLVGALLGDILQVYQKDVTPWPLYS